MKTTLSKESQGIVAIAGHVGCGHSHSLGGQVQDDSPGLSVVLSLFKEATGLSLKLKEFRFEGNTITAIMENGGVGVASARRGISSQEKEIINRIVGKEIIDTHTIVLEQFGRMYGQGVLETPVAVQTAIANAALNGFVVNYPESFVSTVESVPGNCGNIVGAVLEINDIPVSVLGTVNATIGGLGPNEDLEGNSPNYSKKELIERLGMDELPTIIVEAMIGNAFSKGLEESTFYVRGDEQDDNIAVVKAIKEACENLEYPIVHHPNGMRRTKDALRNNTRLVGEKIKALGEALINAETSEEKVNVVGELAIVVSQDCGGVTFMSNDIHEELGGAGMIKKTSAVMNLVVTEEYNKENPIPYLTESDRERYINIVKETVNCIVKNLEVATNAIN